MQSPTDHLREKDRVALPWFCGLSLSDYNTCLSFHLLTVCVEIKTFELNSNVHLIKNVVFLDRALAEKHLLE